jgi:hypothetical protein
VLEEMPRENANISLEKVIGTDGQIEMLFNQLKNRNYAISHRLLPRYQDHITFVKNHPYRYWAIVSENNLSVGTVYLHVNNSIGLNFLFPTRHLVSEALRHIRENFEPAKEIKSKIPSYFYVNVAYANEKLSKILLELDAIPLQMSFKV